MKKIKNVSAYDDLNVKITDLKAAIKQQEAEIQESNLVKFASTLTGKGSIENIFFDKVSSFSLKGGKDIVDTFLLTNPKTRKYYLAYTLAKEFIPEMATKFKSFFKEIKDDFKEEE